MIDFIRKLFAKREECSLQDEEGTKETEVACQYVVGRNEGKHPCTIFGVASLGPCVFWLNEELRLHRTDGPAVEYADGAKEWWQNGLLHRADGPAVEHANGEVRWFLGGRIVCPENLLDVVYRRLEGIEKKIDAMYKWSNKGESGR